MKKLALTLTTLTALVAGLFLVHPSAARAAGDLGNINLTYRGGALLQHVQVSTMFMGKAWQGSKYPSYVNHFFHAPRGHPVR